MKFRYEIFLNKGKSNQSSDLSKECPMQGISIDSMLKNLVRPKNYESLDFTRGVVFEHKVERQDLNTGQISKFKVLYIIKANSTTFTQDKKYIELRDYVYCLAKIDSNNNILFTKPKNGIDDKRWFAIQKINIPDGEGDRRQYIDLNSTYQIR